MKYFICRLEITDGEHGYYSSSVFASKDMKEAVDIANNKARDWYDDEERSENITTPGNEFQSWEHLGGEVICAVDIVTEIPEDHFNILNQYGSFRFFN